MSARPRLVGFGLLAVTFVVGALAGAAVDRVLAVPPPPPPTQESTEAENDEGRRYIIDRVEMSEAQRASIDSILEQRSLRMRAVWNEVEPRMDAITDSARADIMGVLDAEQRAEYEALLERRRQERRARQEADDR